MKKPCKGCPDICRQCWLGEEPQKETLQEDGAKKMADYMLEQFDILFMKHMAGGK